MNDLYSMMDRRDRLANRMALQRELMGTTATTEWYKLAAQHIRDKAERNALVCEINARMESFRDEDLEDREISDNLDI